MRERFCGGVCMCACERAPACVRVCVLCVELEGTLLGRRAFVQ